MAIYHFNGQVIGRISKTGQPKSPVSSAAYRSGEKLHDELENKKWDYVREVKPEAHILTPSHAPDWVNNREKLWNEVNKIEKNYNAQLAREFNIGLPRELSHEQQRELALEFCQEAFVDRGMVADIAIHRDDENNPHFHVMLPTRPFNEDGSWGIKAKREYIYDKDGNHVLDKNGKKAFRKVATTDWDSREVFLSWRKLWADKTNEFLLKNGINEKISHLSNKDRGFESLPTVHEGYAARQRVREGKESDRVNINKKIKEHNNTVSDLKKYKEKKAVREYQNRFARKFSPMEKKTLSKIAKELKMFVNVESIEERKQQLKQWKKSIQFRKDSDTKLVQLERIDKEEVLVAEAKEVFETEGKRFLDKHYPEFDYSEYSTDEMIEIVEKTISNNRILSNDEILLLKKELESNHILKELNGVLKNRFVFTLAVEYNYQKQIKTVATLSEKMGIKDAASLARAKQMYSKGYSLLTQAKQNADNLKEAMGLMHDFYNLEISKNYPTLNVKKMTLEEKEMLVVGTEYYEKPITLDSISELRRYELNDQINIIRLLGSQLDLDKEKLKKDYPNFQVDNPRYVLLFKDECLKNIKELPAEERSLLANITPKEQAHEALAKQFKVNDIDEGINQAINDFTYMSVNGFKAINGLTEAMFHGLLESRNFDSRKQFEEDLNSKSKSKSKKRNIHSSGPSL